MDFTETVIERNQSDVPMIETDFYKWLKRDGNYSDNILATKLRYLVSLGFTEGADRISADVLTCLGYIQETFWRLEVKA